MDEQKSTLSMTRGEDFEELIELFRKTAGREPTPEEMEEARKEWDAGS